MKENSDSRQFEPEEEIVQRRDFRRISRRELLKLSPLAIAGAIAIPTLRDSFLKHGLRWSDRVAHAAFREQHLAATFADHQVAPLEKFPYNFYDVLDPEIDLSTWTLTVSGLVQCTGEYRLAQIQALPKMAQNTRYVCIEGWDVIGNFGGARISDFLKLVGADPNARFVEVECADDYYESIDMESARHPQSLLCYEMYGQPLNRGHGAPLRLQIPTKLGYKQAKYLTAIHVTNVLSGRKLLGRSRI